MSKVDLTDIIALLTDLRRPRFQHEKHIALMTFSAWLNWPNNSEVLEHAQIVSAATCFLDSGGKRNPLVTTENLCNALLVPPIAGQFVDLSESSMNLRCAAVDILSFFLCCPATLKPSLNKAFFFLDEGGSKGWEIDLAPELQGDDPRSIPTLKIAWKERAITAPFAWALGPTGMDELPLPDEEDSFKRADRILRKPKRLHKYFGASKFVQDRLLALLDSTSKQRSKFIKLPDKLEPVECESDPLDEEQLKILARYRAPYFTKLG